MRKSAVKHPILLSVIVVFVFFVANFLGSMLLVYSPPFFWRNGDFLQQLVAESVMCLFGIALVGIFGYGKIWNQTESFGRGLLCGGYIIVVSVYSAVGGLVLEASERGPDFAAQLAPLWKFLVFAISMFLIGLTEESFFRGVVANLFWDKHAKDPAGVWAATIYSGLVFALMHGINLLSADIGGVLVQMAAIITMGMALTAIYYRSKNIWVVIFLHAFLDFCGLLPSALFENGSISTQISSYSPVVAITSSIPYLIVTLVLLRKKKLVQMLAGENAFGAIPSAANGQLVISADIPSTESSKKSRRRAIIAAVVIWLGLFAGSVYFYLESYDFSVSKILTDVTGSEVFSTENSGIWSRDDDTTFGSAFNFTVGADGNYQISCNVDTGLPNAYAFIQIVNADGEAVFEENYGGFCSETSPVELEQGDYTLNIVYNYAEVDLRRITDDVDYSVSVSIR